MSVSCSLARNRRGPGASFSAFHGHVDSRAAETQTTLTALYSLFLTGCACRREKNQGVINECDLFPTFTTAISEELNASNPQTGNLNNLTAYIEAPGALSFTYKDSALMYV